MWGIGVATNKDRVTKDGHKGARDVVRVDRFIGHAKGVWGERQGGRDRTLRRRRARWGQ